MISVSGLVEHVMLDVGSTGMTSGTATLFVTKAVRRLNRRLHLIGTVSAMAVSGAYVLGADNDDFQDFIVMQAECLIAKRQQGEAVSKGIRIRSGQDEIDTTAGFRGYGDVTSSICDELEEAIADYLEEAEKAAGYSTVAEDGAMIWYGEQRKYEDVDHDGQYSEREHPFDSAFDDDVARDL